jgi:DNA-binding transcriptional LysR family regulator
MTFVYPHLHEFSARYPKIALDLQVSDRVVDLVANGFDLALRAGHPGDSDFVVKHLLRYRRLTCASPAYLAQHGTPRKPSDLGSHHCLLYRHEPQASSWRFRVDGATVAIPVNCRFSSNESHALLAWARSGMGITLQPDWLVEEDLKSGRLIAVLGEYGIESSHELPTIYAVLLKPKNQPKKVEAFVKFFGEKIEAKARPVF